MREGSPSRILQLLSLELFIVGPWVLALPAHQLGHPGDLPIA